MLSGKKSNFNFQNGVFLEKKIEIRIGSRHFLTSEAECPEKERKGGGRGSERGSEGAREREREREGEGEGKNEGEGDGKGEGAGESSG